MPNSTANCLENLTPKHEEKIRRIPFLNIDPYIIPSPYVRDKELDKDYQRSFVWNEEGEILGYLLVYSNAARGIHHIYKQITSPFGRGKGIGSAFVERLACEVPAADLVYLYIWDKQVDSINFFETRGFKIGDRLTYRKLTFLYMSATAAEIASHIQTGKERKHGEEEELGRTRHDARKNVKLMLDMVNMLSVDNSNKIIEDIQRETRALINLLNSYGDKVEREHAISLKDIIIERVVPFIEASGVPCEIRLILKNRVSEVTAHFLDVSRALINMVANSLDAIDVAGREGLIEITLSEVGGAVRLEIFDNGLGIPAELLVDGGDGVPRFVGVTTKKRRVSGEGIGTKQIFSTFGGANIKVESGRGEYTRWTITIPRRDDPTPTLISDLRMKFNELRSVSQQDTIDGDSSRDRITMFIWRLRQLEIFTYELVFLFSNHNNIRDIYRVILAYRYGDKDFDFLRDEIAQCRSDHPELNEWLITMARIIKSKEEMLERHAPFSRFRGALFKSYGQAVDSTIIFTLDPETDQFLCSDRKLAEHLDFVQYLGKSRDELLRGELHGDLNNLANPIHLGVWSVQDDADLNRKLRLVRRGAKSLIRIGVNTRKRLAFYNTTYNTAADEIDTGRITTLGVMAHMPDDELQKFVVRADDELQGLVFAD